MKYAFEHPVKVHAVHLVHLALAYHANENTGRCYPSIDTLCRETGLGRVSVFKAIAELERVGTISKAPYQGPNHVHVYTVHTLNSSSREPFTQDTSTVQPVNCNGSASVPKSPLNHKESPIEEPITPHGVKSAHNISTSADQKEKSAENPRKKDVPAAGAHLADAEFIAQLKVNVAYKHLDVDVELGKIDAWLLTPKGSRRKKTREFVVNWLNRIDRPMEPEKKVPAHLKQANRNY